MRLGRVMIALLASAAVVGCAPQGDEDPMPTPTATQTVVTKAAVPLPRIPHGTVTGPLPAVRVDHNTIHVGSRAYDVAPLRADAAVSTRGGVYFLNAGEVWYLDDRGARGTGYAHVRRLVVSSDGRYLGLVDRNHGPVDAAKVQIATAVAYDTTTGRVALHSRAGMRGSSAGAADTDLRALYRRHPPVATGFFDDALIASTPAGMYVYPLSGAAPHPQS